MSDQSEMTLAVHTTGTAGLDAVVSASELETAVEELRGEDLNVRFQTERGNFVEPVTGTLVVVGVIAGGKFVMRVIREARGGTVIDMTKTPVEISRNKNLDYGYFVIIAKDGSVTVEAKDEPKDALERMITEALKLGGEVPLETLKEAIEGELGATASLELKPGTTQ
jgi:hypothetical protein